MLSIEQEVSSAEVSLGKLIDQASQFLADGTGDEILIDCAEVTTIRSGMLDQLIRLHLKSQRHDVRLILINVSPTVLDVIHRTRLDRMLRIRIDDGDARPPQNHLLVQS